METITPIIHWLQDFAYLLPWLGGIVLTILLLAGLTNCILRLADRQWLKTRPSILLELTPPANVDKLPVATQRFFAMLHGLETTRPLLHKLLRRSASFSLEIVSTRDQGIRYLMRVPENEAMSFEQAVTSYLPGIRCRRVEEYLGPYTNQAVRVLDFKQTGYFAYPLRLQGIPEEHDPIAYLTGSMTKLEPNELVAFQVVVTPTRLHEAELLAGRLMHNQELVYSLGQRRSPILGFLLNGIGATLFAILDGIGDITSGGAGRMVSQRDYYRKHEINIKARPARILSAAEQTLADSVQSKLSQPLFGASIRALVVAHSEQAAKQRTKTIRESLALFKVPKYQSLQDRQLFPRQLKIRYRLSVLQHRLPTLWRGSSAVLAASEIADLYHFPHSQSAKTENVVKSLSKTLAAPISLKNGTKFDVIIGRNEHHGLSTNIGLSAAERERHVYIIGGTGNGKTTMMKYAIVQDIQNGRGVAVVDPHGDLAEELLRYIPEDRINDVVYFNPADLGHPIGLNLLELPEGLSGDELLDAKDFITEAVISVMRKVFSDDDSGGHRIEYVLRNAVQTALTLKEPTLFTIFDLLTNPQYRKKIVRGLQDEKLKNFWRSEFGKAGDFQRVKMAAGVTAKIGRFQFSASAERILSQPKSTINFEEILDGKILICNFAKGLIGEDTSELFGISTLAKLQLAAYRRVKQKQADRKPFYLYVDEFQNFATMSFVQMLSEARKYKVFLTMAEQSTSQQDDLRMVNTILANVGTVVCFRSGNPTDEQLLLPLFRPYLEEGEIANLPTYNFYARMSAVLSQEPVSGETIVLENSGSEEGAKKVIIASRANYAIAYAPKAEPKLRQRTKKNDDAPLDSKPSAKPRD